MIGPDRGWSWVVALSACFVSLVLSGIFRTSGVLFVAFIDAFKVNREQAAWPMVVCISVLNFTGPVSSILGEKWGIRPVVLLGSLIGAVGVSACFFTTSLTIITILFGGVFGFGFGLIATLMPVIVNAYFLNQRSTANGIAYSGSCFGSILLPILYEYLMDSYSLSGCFLITGGIVLNIAVAGALLRPPSFSVADFEQTESTDKVQDVEKSTPCQDGSRSCNGCIGDKCPQKCFESVALLDPKSSVQKDLQAELANALTNRRNNVPKIHVEDDFSNYKTSFSCDESLTSSFEQSEVHLELQKAQRAFEDSLTDFEAVADLTTAALDIVGTSKSDDMLNRSDNNITPSDITEGCPARHSFSISSAKRQQLNKFKSPIPDSGPLKKCSYRLRTPSGDTNLSPVGENSVLTSPPIAETDVEASKEEESRVEESTPTFVPSCSPSILHSFLTVLTSPYFHLTALTNVIFYFMFHMYLNVVVDYALDSAIAQDSTKYILFAFSLSDLFGRLCLGWVTDRRFVTRPRFMMSGMAGISLVFLVMPFATDYWSLIFVSCCYGVFLGSTMIHFPILLLDFLGTDMHAVAYGSLCFMNGFSSLIRPFLIGYFRDSIGSYDHIFYILSGISLFASSTWLVEKFLTPRQHQTTQSSPVKS